MKLCPLKLATEARTKRAGFLARVVALGLMVGVLLAGFASQALASVAETNGAHPRVLLVLVTLEGNENLQGFLIDPEVKARLGARGWKVEGRGIEEVRREHFAAADAVVILQEPYAVNVKGVAAWRKMLPELDHYLRAGGGALVVFDDRYFQVFGPTNELLGAYGARAVREAVIDAAAENTSHLVKDDGVAVLRTTNLDRHHPVTAGIAGMAFPQTEAGKDTYPLVISSDWTPLVRAEKTARSEDVWSTDRHSSFAAEPVLVAARQVDRGRLIYFGAHSSLTFLHGSHPRWDDGFFLRAGMMDFFERALDWLEQAPAKAQGTMPALVGDPVPTTNLDPVNAAAQQPIATWQAGAIVLLAKAPASLEAWTRELSPTLNWVALVLPDSALPQAADYARWKRLCAEASRPDFLVIPGVKAHDAFRNSAAILNPASWPLRGAARTFNHIAREIGGHPVLLSPAANPWPAENIGGFQGFALAEYEGSRLAALNLEKFHALQAKDWFLVPQVVFSQADPATVAGVLKARGYRTLVPAQSVDDVPLKFPFLFHNERNVVVSRGPVIRQAGLVGAHLINDPWEGVYYLWSGPGDHATYALDVTGAGAGSEVRVYRDELLWRRYLPGTPDWRHEVAFASTEALHSYWAELWREGQLEAISSASRSRNFTNWAHGGGDRMNLYHSVMREDPRGGLRALGKPLTGFGSLLFNEGWGDTASIRPTIDGGDFYPAGHEWGLPSGGVEYLRFSPQVRADGQREYVVSKPERLGYAMASEQGAVLRETVGRVEGLVDGLRVVQPAKLTQARTSYTIPVWELNGPLSFIVDTEITALQDLDLGADPQVQVLEFVGRSAGKFSQVTVGTDGGRGPTVSLFNDGPAHGRHSGRWFLVSPDPLGAVLVAGLGEGDYRLTAEATAKGPRVRFSIAATDRRWPKGKSVHVRFGFALTSGKEADPVEAASGVMALWTGRQDLFVASAPGARAARLGEIELTLPKRGWIARPLVGGKRAAPLMMVLDTGSARLPVYELGADERGHGFLPLGQEGDRAYATLSTDRQGEFRAGRIVDCSRDVLQVDVKSLSEHAVECWVHNPSPDEQSATLQLTGLVSSQPDAQRITLQPGEEKLVTFTRQ